MTKRRENGTYWRRVGSVDRTAQQPYAPPAPTAHSRGRDLGAQVVIMLGFTALSLRALHFHDRLCRTKSVAFDDSYGAPRANLRRAYGGLQSPALRRGVRVEDPFRKARRARWVDDRTVACVSRDGYAGAGHGVPQSELEVHGAGFHR